MNRKNQLKILLILLLAMSFVLPVQAGRARSAERAMEALAEANAQLAETANAEGTAVALPGGSSNGPRMSLLSADRIMLYDGEGESAAGEPFYIWIDGRRITSDQEASGTSWQYDPEKQWLTLYDYNGAEIVAYGDLAIWSYGETVIQGNNYHGIACNGVLELYCMSGTLTARGGSAQGENAYVGAYAASQLFCTPVEGTTITLEGGPCNVSTTFGGDGASAPVVFLTQNGQVNITGGAAADPAQYGGYAVYANRLFVFADSTFKGGAGPLPSEAVWMWDDCTIGHVNVVMESSGAGCRALPELTEDGPYLYINYSDYVSAADASKLEVTPRKYMLTVDYAGGTVDGETSVTAEVAFKGNQEPVSLDLTGIVPVRYGYAQTGWHSRYVQPKPTAEDPQAAEVLEADVALGTVYQMPFGPKNTALDVTLTAVWQYTGPEYVMGETTVAVAVPYGWCAENSVSGVMLAVYDSTGKLLGANSVSRTEENDLWVEVTPDLTKATSCAVFFLNENSAPVLDALPKVLVEEQPPEEPGEGGAGEGSGTEPGEGGEDEGSGTEPGEGGAGEGSGTEPGEGGAGEGSGSEPGEGGAGEGSGTEPEAPVE